MEEQKNLPYQFNYSNASKEAEIFPKEIFVQNRFNPLRGCLCYLLSIPPVAPVANHIEHLRCFGDEI